jgi:signal transduction histidine kinase
MEPRQRSDPDLTSALFAGKEAAASRREREEMEEAVLAELLRYTVTSKRLSDQRFREAQRRALRSHRSHTERLARRQEAESARLQGLAQTALALNTILAPDAILNVLAERSRALIGAHIAVASLDGDDGTPATTAIATSAWHARLRAATTGFTSLEAIVTASEGTLAPRRLTRADLITLLSAESNAIALEEARVPRGWLAAPLLGTDGRRIGLVQLWDKPISRRGSRDFTAEDEAVLAQLAHVASVAAENARLFREVQDAVRTRDNFLATVTHDLRNPLASIRGYAQLLLRQERRSDSPRPRSIHALETIEATTTRMEHLVDELLDVARVRAGQPLALERAETDLVAVARGCIEAHQGTTTRHVLRLESDHPRITGEWDTGRLQRVLDNLLSNAIKFSPDGGTVIVSLSRQAGGAPSDHSMAHQAPSDQDVVVLSVQDHGLGIPAADLPHIFERFSRGGNVVSRVPGTGIGLAGVRQIVEQHGGTIQVRSQERMGSTFIVRLPIVAGATLAPSPHPRPPLTTSPSTPPSSRRLIVTADTPTSPASPPHTSTPRGRVLIVEDDALTQAVLREALLDEGYRVLEAADGEAALNLIDAESPDVILLDLRLPVMDGPTFAQRYRQAVPAPVPIIVVTASEHQAIDARRMAAAAVVTKPFIVEELLQLVDRHAFSHAA